MDFLVSISIVSATIELTGITTGNPGAIWTTNGDCGIVSQDVNHFNIGDVVYINGDNFDAALYGWAITGNPGGSSGDPGIDVADGTFTVDLTGAFCFAAYTVQPDDWGEDKVSFGKKGDNYRVPKPGDEVPEFGTIGAVLALVGAGLYMYKKRK